MSKTHIAETISRFATGALYDNARNLFHTLGYNTGRQGRLDQNNFQGFKDSFVNNPAFSETRALTAQWQKVELLFQLTYEEMQSQIGAFQPTVNRSEPASFLFFAIELTGSFYSENKLAVIAREINKLFPMHVFVLFKYGGYLSLSLIDRRQNKKIMDRDVIEKVTHVYNVNIAKPHAGHVSILYQFSLESIISEAPKRKIQNFNDLIAGWRRVMNTEILNKYFYLEYQRLSKQLIGQLNSQFDSKIKVHQAVLNLLNRLMFLYFVQKKGWLNNDDNFLFHFWGDYKEYKTRSTAAELNFHQHWLNALFFSAFNNQFFRLGRNMAFLPEKYQDMLLRFPYLNGGLFTRHNELDDFSLPDDTFEDIFAFFQSYIFTIAEDTPYEITLEVNPELLGKMYEGMINSTDVKNAEGEHGIVYTERPEINFMVRRSFVEVLEQKTSRKHSREFLYHFIFDPIPQKIELIQKYKVNAEPLKEAVKSITALDPACGSGSMLLGVLQVQVELIRALDESQGRKHTPTDDFQLKKQLISECLYGVDVKEWAVRIAELRLWLNMIAEAEFTPQELTEKPLLPNLDFKLRPGNSLLQRFGGVDFSLSQIIAASKKRGVPIKPLQDFISRKKAFICNELPNVTFDQLKKEERHVFERLIDHTIIAVEKELQALNIKSNTRMDSFLTEIQYQTDTKDIFADQRQELVAEIEQLKNMRRGITSEKRLPFSFDLDFMEIFLLPDKETEKGFDLVIGNPPYVRQEDILPPEDPMEIERLLLSENKDEKARLNKRMKEDLNSKVYEVYPFLATDVRTEVDGKKKTIPVYGRKTPGRSDLYVYFQLLCPRFLHAKGTFCFIISNSWLDVEYGGYIQHFLLKHTRLYAVYDCNVRSFDAAVNTIIYLHSAVINHRQHADDYKTLTPPEQTAQFVMNKIDYAEAAYAPLLLEQSHCRENTFRDFYRVIPLSQKQLFANGYDADEKSYAGDKWGGKYLRAPEIYYTLLEKGRGKLVRLGDVAEVRRGFTTGANEFFILDEETRQQWQIEPEFLVPILKSPRECRSILIDESKLKLRLFYCHKDKKDLRGTNALKYIEWGEQSELDGSGKELRQFNLRKSCSGRTNWYDVGIRLKSPVNCNYLVDSLMRFYFGVIYVSDNFQEVHYSHNNIREFVFSCNSTLFALFLNIVGRANFGDGLMKIQTFEVEDLLLLNPDFLQIEDRTSDSFQSFVAREHKSIYEELGFDKTRPIREQTPQPLADRQALDDLIFDELDLTAEERTEVYWSVAELVKQRLDKAASR